MAGLLDDPNQVGLLSLGLRLMSTPGKFGSALGTSGLGAMGDMQQAQAAQQMARQRAMQEQMLQMQMEEAKRAQAERQKQAERQQMDESTMTRLLGLPVENRQAMADMGPGVPMANRGIDPQTFLKQGGSLGGLGGVLGLNQALAPVAKKPIVSKPGDIARDESGAMLWQNPAEPEKQNLTDLVIIGPDGKPMINQLALDAKRAVARAGASSTSVSYGAPVAGVDSAGNPIYFQPSKDGGKPAIIPGVAPTPNKSSMTEDQGKATGWLIQAENAHKNMLAAGFDKNGNPKSAVYPGVNDAIESIPGMAPIANAMRTADRQKFLQASESLSEALLRAATGAGVNKDEAAQKVRELTPRFGEDPKTTKQKMAAIPLYIDSLKVRAGPGAAKASNVIASQPAGIHGVGKLTPAEQEELDALRRMLGK